MDVYDAQVDWRVYLAGNSLDLITLRSALTTGAVVVKQDDNGTYLCGSILSCASAAPAEILLRATDLMPRLNGVGRVVDPGFEPVRVSGRVWNGTHPVTVFAEAHLRARARLSTSGEASIAQRTLSRALEDDAFDQVLRLVGASPELDWVDLYKVYELLKKDAGGESALRTRAGVTKTDLKAFTASANLPEVSGAAARHAVGKGGVPTSTMTQAGARRFILSIMRSW